jgi:hypothetical protein
VATTSDVAPASSRGDAWRGGCRLRRRTGTLGGLVLGLAAGLLTVSPAAASPPIDSAGPGGCAGAAMPVTTWVTQPSLAATAVPVDKVRVRTFVHVLRSPNGPKVSRERVVAQVRVLNGAHAGRQSARAAQSPFRFDLVGITRTVNRRWDHMTQGSVAERHAKRHLHRGDANDLNLYLVAGDDGALGWSTTPADFDAEPWMDGVVVARATLPGGSRGPYSAGDAAVHETGHWFGLLHTFAGRCGGRGDRVADTPSEARPSYRCPVGRDTCSGPGKDPVHNFMDYSHDACMNHFTEGQADRMWHMWQRFRAGGS